MTKEILMINRTGLETLRIDERVLKYEQTLRAVLRALKTNTRTTTELIRVIEEVLNENED